MQELIRYDYAVLDAVDMKNGFCHTEIKIDSKGPVLIETNARPMGANLTAEYLDEIFGYHMTDLVLKSLLEPTFFQNFARTPYLPRKCAMFKFSIVPRDVDADLGPFFEIVRHLDSYREINYFGQPGTQHYPRTIDLETSPFFIKMVNEDYGDLKRDYELLRQMEERYFDMVFSSSTDICAAEPVTDLDSIISELPLARRFGLVKDDGKYVIQYGRCNKAENWGVYDGIIFAKCGKDTLTDRFRDIMEAMSQIRKGGIILIVPEAYSNLPYGTVGAETIMTIMGFIPEIPPSTGRGFIYGMRR